MGEIVQPLKIDTCDLKKKSIVFQLFSHPFFGAAMWLVFRVNLFFAFGWRTNSSTNWLLIAKKVQQLQLQYEQLLFFAGMF